MSYQHQFIVHNRNVAQNGILGNFVKHTHSIEQLCKQYLHRFTVLPAHNTNVAHNYWATLLEIPIVLSNFVKSTHSIGKLC